MKSTIDFAPLSALECARRHITDVRVTQSMKDRMLRPFLDGKEISRVFRACPDEGWLDRYVTDEDGVILHIGDAVAKERLYGKVELRT